MMDLAKKRTTMERFNHPDVYIRSVGTQCNLTTSPDCVAAAISDKESAPTASAHAGQVQYTHSKCNPSNINRSSPIVGLPGKR